MYQRLLRKVVDDLANGIDRPSFGPTIIKTQSKHAADQNSSKPGSSGICSPRVGKQRLLHCSGGFSPCSSIPMSKPAPMPELDEVVGRGRPPSFADIPFLPYIRAMYEGMFIPKGTIILQNVRVLNFDPEVFGSNMAEFDPSRYLDEKGQVMTLIEGREEGHMQFGFGRRVCLGGTSRKGRSGSNLRHCFGDAV
ncbi:cytochrome P450 [Lactarius akahatsu]|uniref:Cytochrome P450 n=1 Tax=Lactarius akahatsu TaxID=416441 RepID=A0AAD4L9K2_9AGAM|nr:cytochrome P450 [Lactarius akahatsu]